MANLPTNLTVLAGAGIASLVASGIKDRNTRTAIQVGAGIAALIASFDISTTAFRAAREQNKKFWDAVKDAASLPFGAGSLFERGLGSVGRFIGQEPEAGIRTDPDKPADKGPYLGTPKNLFGIAGRIRTIENQQIDPAKENRIRTPLFADTVLVDAAVENQSASRVTGKFEARVIVRDNTRIIPGPDLNLAPGEFRQVTLRIPRDSNYFDRYRLSLMFENHSLDTVTYLAL